MLLEPKCAELSGIKSLYTQGKIVDLTLQSNYYCLLGINNCNKESRKIKQLSEKWFELRKEAKVTGSTLHRAIGLGTLKEAQAHFESVYNGVEKPEPSHNKKKAMKHGRDNEINTVATLVGKLLPVHNCICGRGLQSNSIC